VGLFLWAVRSQLEDFAVGQIQLELGLLQRAPHHHHVLQADHVLQVLPAWLVQEQLEGVGVACEEGERGVRG